MKRGSTKTILQFVFSIVAVMSIQISNAQIIYTDLNPDATIAGTYNLDLNNDGTIDFVIAHTTKFVKNSGQCRGGTGTNHYIRVTPVNNCQVLDYNGTNATKMAPNEAIDASALTWSSNSNQVMVSSVWGCNYFCPYGICGYSWGTSVVGQWYWYDVVDGFLGLKLISGGHTYYGWVRIDITPGFEAFTIRDYAYNSTPDQAILAGQSSAEYLGVSTIISGTPAIANFCAGNNVTVPYIIAGTFSASNVVTAELSDAAGSFASPVAIGNVTSNVSGNISAVIPALTPSGTAYRIRVRSSNPARTSYPNSYNLTMSGGGLPDAIIRVNPYFYCDSINPNICNCDVSLLATYYEESCYSYQWQLNGNDIPGATSRSYNPTVAGDYTCIITNGVGSVTSNTITVTANPVSALINASGETTVCGGSVDLYNSGRSGTYQWKLNGNDIPNATNYYFYANITGAYTLVKTTVCGIATSNAIPVTIYPPMADTVITATGLTICSGTVVLNANTGSGLSYQWYDVSYPYNTTNPRLISGAISSSYAASVTGVYYVKETNSAGCSKQSNYIVALIGNPHPIIYPSSVTVCQGNPVNLHAEPSEYVTPPNAYSYQWIKDGVDISNATAQNYTVKKPGTYSVRVTLNSGGCSGTSAGVIITQGCTTSSSATNNSSPEKDQSIVAGKSNPAEEKFVSLSIAPNPISSSTTISFTLKQTEKISLRIYDINGRFIKILADREFTAGNHEVNWNVENLKTGIYILRLQTQTSDITKKLVVVK